MQNHKKIDVLAFDVKNCCKIVNILDLDKIITSYLPKLHYLVKF